MLISWSAVKECRLHFFSKPQLGACLVTCNWLVIMVPTRQKEEWSTASMDFGEQFQHKGTSVQTTGRWCAEGLGSKLQVRSHGKTWAAKLNHQTCFCLGVQLFNSSYYGEGTGPIVYNGLNCDGSESKLEECDLSDVPYYTTHFYDVGIKCYEKGTNIQWLIP